ncbi:MAG TPA: hypothetical protein VI796_06850 [Candidatus Thermoplasmatota archaeon]|nr:hypothetical protein [Candidatus Thermoplasmatota archaeon]
MSSRLPLVLLVLLLAALPPVGAQTEPVATVAVEGLASGVAANGTLAAAPFQVTLTLTNLVCVGAGPFSFPVTLSAESSDPDADARVNPATVTFEVAPGQSLIQAYAGTRDATLLVDSGPFLDGHPIAVNVTATFEGGNHGCQGLGGEAAGIEVSADTVVTFGAAEGVNPPTSSEELPGPTVPLLALALGALALIVRRRR